MKLPGVMHWWFQSPLEASLVLRDPKKSYLVVPEVSIPSRGFLGAERKTGILCARVLVSIPSRGFLGAENVT